MGYILKNTSGLINTRLTDAGRQKLSQGRFNISYFQIGDSEVSYNVIPNFNYTNFNVLEPSFNAQNTAGAPQSNKENIKYPIFVDEIGGNTYGIPFMDSIVESVYNTAQPRGFFTGTPITETSSYTWSAKTNNLYAINSNYVVQMNSLVGTNTIDVIFNSCNPSVVRNISVGDIVTIYYDGSGLVDCNCSNFPTPTPTPTNTSTPTPSPSACFTCLTYGITGTIGGGEFKYTNCGENNPQTIIVGNGVTTVICSSTYPIEIAGNGTISTAGDCGSSPCPSSTPTPTPTQSYDPCQLTPTPTPTPSSTFCPTPTPSNPCPQPPPPDCVVSLSSCFPILTYRVVNVCLNTLTLDRTTPDFSYLSNDCYARTIVYPPNMNEIYDSITPSRHWNDDVINFESVCYTDQFNVNIWNMNIPWSESPAGLDSSTSNDYTKFGSVNYLGTKEYLGYASSSGQTDTSFSFYLNSFDEVIQVTPEQQKAIAIIHYTNQTIDLFYGEKFATQPFDDSVEDTTGQGRNFKLHLPWLMWHKNPNCCLGQTFWVDPPGFEDFKLFQVNYIKSTKNLNMNDPGIRYFHLWDNNPNPNALTPNIPNRVGKVFPDLKIIVIDDEELIAAMSYKSNRNWTLPAPKVALITPNICGLDNNSVEGILTGSSQTLYVTYRLSNNFGFTNSLHCNYYQAIQGPNVSCNPLPSQNVSVRFGGEFGCLESPIVTTTTTIQPSCPCWYSGFTFFFVVEASEVLGFFAYPTNQILNGKPIFYLIVLEDILNIFWDGINWVLTDGIYNIEIDFTNNEPIGQFSINNGESTITGFTTCEKYETLVIEVCGEAVGGECVFDLYYPKLNNGVIEYTNFSNLCVFDDLTDLWILEYPANTPIATISNTPPIGSWSIINLGSGFDSVNSYSIFDYYTIGCSCYDISTTEPYIYYDCYGVIYTGDTSVSNLCVLTLTVDSVIDPQITFFGEAVIVPCENICTTTTTVFDCNTPIITTTTTTICPEYCSVPNGFYADTFQIICQKVDGNGRPEPTEWKIIDFTDQLSASTIGGFITEQGLTGSTFVITQDLYDEADTYVLTDYIDLPSGTTTNLNFGDEYYFYGNIETDIQATIYEMRYKINLGQSEFLTSSNPTWDNTKKVHISEIGLYDSDKTLMIVSKLQAPYPRTGIQQFVVKFDF